MEAKGLTNKVPTFVCNVYLLFENRLEDTCHQNLGRGNISHGHKMALSCKTDINRQFVGVEITPDLPYLRLNLSSYLTDT